MGIENSVRVDDALFYIVEYTTYFLKNAYSCEPSEDVPKKIKVL